MPAKSQWVYSENKVEDALRRWRKDIAHLDNEVEEYILPEQAIIQIAYPSSNASIVDICRQALNGYVPAYVEAYQDKIASIIKLAA